MSVRWALRRMACQCIVGLIDGMAVCVWWRYLLYVCVGGERGMTYGLHLVYEGIVTDWHG
jgi:hypothetical protein